MRSAEECGLDSRNLRSLQDITRPALFPDIKLHSSGDNRILRLMEQKKAEEAAKAEAAGMPIKCDDDGPKSLASIKRSSKTIYLIQKGRQIQQRMQSSVFYVRPSKDVPDVIRYSDAAKPPPQIDARAVLSHCLEGRTCTEMGRYVPEELVSGQINLDSNETGKRSRNGVNLASLEAQEKSRRRLGSIDVDDGEGVLGDADEEILVDDGEEDDGDDYVKDHYESDGDESGGDDNEATF
jgi:hypothetical protein